MKNSIQIKIWSDIMCPFCYIGKRKLEEALDKFPNREAVEIQWKSFELDPHFVANPDESLAEHLSQKYGRDLSWARSMMENMTENAKSQGLDFHFENAVMANTLNAHRLLHLAKENQKDGLLKELLFKAYLTDGLNLNDWSCLQQLAKEALLPEQKLKDLMDTDRYIAEVRADEQEAKRFGINSVPFFVINDTYGISGAQPRQVFLETLEKAWADQNSSNS